MELNDDNKSNKSQKSEIDLLINNPIKDLIDLKNTIETSLSNTEQQTKFLKDIKQKIFHSLYENHSYKKNYQIIEEIINNLEKYLLTHEEDMQSSLIEVIESLMMLFLFHFDFHINKIGFELLNFLINNLEDSYCNELLDYFIKIIQLLNLKKQANNNNSSFISSLIISNISLAIYEIMSNNQILKENKKSLFDFIKKNINNTNLIYSLLIHCDNISIKYSKIFNNDEIKFIYEKISEMLNKTYTFFNNNLPRKKTDVLYIKENVNKIGFFCKILDCITIEGNRTYLIDKLIKGMIPLGQKILETINLLPQNNELKFSTETIENIFGYLKTIGVFSFENILKTISFVNKKYNDYSCDYLSIIIYLVQELERLSLSCEENKIKNIVLLIIQIIEVVLQKNKAKNNNKLFLDIFELYKICQIYKILTKIDPKPDIPQNKFPNTYKYFVFDDSTNKIDDIEKGFKEKNFDYLSQIYLDSIAIGNKDNNFINKKCFLDCLNKFEDFKNSIKESLAIKNGFTIDKNIEEEKKKINDKENVTYEDFENYIMKNSMEMFKEIYSKD